MKGLYLFLLGWIVGMILLLVIQHKSGDTYKQGQIDALNGKIQYQLVNHPNKTVTWELIVGH